MHNQRWGSLRDSDHPFWIYQKASFVLSNVLKACKTLKELALHLQTPRPIQLVGSRRFLNLAFLPSSPPLLPLHLFRDVTFLCPLLGHSTLHQCVSHSSTDECPSRSLFQKKQMLHHRKLLLWTTTPRQLVLPPFGLVLEYFYLSIAKHEVLALPHSFNTTIGHT